MSSCNPQNPYQSFLVSASAGCGKTYQLSQRFLYLVASGSHPNSILTITFTKKAANEMRARIIADATNLWSSLERQGEFNRQMQRFAPKNLTKAPLTAVATAEAILSSTQQLKVSTIDSVYYEWIKRHSDEALGKEFLKTRPELIDGVDSFHIYEAAWDAVLSALSSKTTELPDDIQALIAEEGLLSIRRTCEGLLKSESYLWMQAQILGDTPFIPLQDEYPVVSGAEELHEIKERLNLLAAHASPALATQIDLARTCTTLAELLATKLISTELKLSGTFIRGKIKEQQGALIDTINEAIRQLCNAEKIKRLNTSGLFYIQLYSAFIQVRDAMKAAKGQVEFNDLTKGCFRLFTDHALTPARYFLEKNIDHIMLDEFQDTSNLQWSIFAELCKDLLMRNTTGERASPSTVFIVGDAKQSIYGFREAEPKLMQKALIDLRDYGLTEVPLNESYRSANFLMTFVNAVFSDTGLMPNFPAHAAARNPDGSFINADFGLIKIIPMAENDEENELKAVQVEAQSVARELSYVLHNASLYPVFDKNQNRYRPIEARDCAILFRNGTHAWLYERELERAGIASMRERSQGFFNRPEINDAMALLKACAYPDDLLSICVILKSPMMGVSDTAVLHALQAARQPQDDHIVRLDLFWHHLLISSKEAHTAKMLLAKSTKLSPHALLLEIIEGSAMQNYARLYDQESYEQIKANLVQFIELCLTIEKEGTLSYASLTQKLVDFHELDGLGNATTSPNAVNMITIHKSKGLEYPLIFLVDCASPWEKPERYWVKRTDDLGRSGFSFVGRTKQDYLHGDRSFDYLLDQSLRELQDESLRILYVALTRARQYLFASAFKPRARASDNGRQIEPTFYSVLVHALSSYKTCQGSTQDDLVYEHGLTEARHQLADVPLTKHAPTDAVWDFRPPCSEPLVSQILTVRPSATSHPLGFRGQSLDGPLVQGVSQVTDPKNSQNAKKPDHQPRLFGIVLHAMLEEHFKANPFPFTYWQQKLGDDEANLSEREISDLCAAAQRNFEEIISSAAWTKLTAAALSCRSEVPFVSLRDDRLIRGSIDLLVETPTCIRIIDFKTSEDVRDGEDRFQHQLGFYKQAVSSMYPGKQIEAGVFFTANCSYEPLMT